MLHYILQTIVFQLLFLMVYDVFLKKETFFNSNRFYLLTSALLSILLPFIKIESFKTVIPKAYIYVLPEIILGKTNATTQNTEAILNTVNEAPLTFSWAYLLYFGCAIALILFTVKFYKLLKMAYKNPKIKFKNAFLVELANSKHAFSFFNYIFLGNKINAEDKQTILTHELQHVKEKHSIDLLFFEVLKILFWFNPLIYIYQKRIANLHEFIADSKAVKSSNKVNYYQNLLSQVFDTKKVSFINPFFKQSLIKKRIIMLSKSKSKQIHLVKYLLVFPMVIGMLFYTSCTNEEKINETTETSSKLSEEELVEKYITELREQKKENKNMFNINSEEFKPYNSAIINDNYLQNLDEYARSKAYMFIINEGIISSKTEQKDNKAIENWQSKIEELVSEKYENYLLKKQTQESIDKWENSPRHSQLRKHVKDLDNITAEEQKLIDSKMIQIETDEFYNTLIVSDGLRHKKTEFEKENLDEINDTDAISFINIESVPVYPGCDTSASNNEKRKCLSKSINSLVAENFDLDLGKKLGLIGKQRIYVRFNINKNGNIVLIKTRAPHPALEEEARRVVKLIPQLQPGKQGGKLVNITYDLPITFNVQE